MKVRTAQASDAKAVHRLVSHYASEQLLLPRTPEEISEHIERFLVLVDGEAEAGQNGSQKNEIVLGCVALEPYGTELAEIRSLAVAPEARGHGHKVGDHLMKAAIEAAQGRMITRLFAVTHRPEFFSRYGFVHGPRQMVAEKIERDCTTCSKEPNCTLVATVAVICPERDLLPVMTGAGEAHSGSYSGR